MAPAAAGSTMETAAAKPAWRKASEAAVPSQELVVAQAELEKLSAQVRGRTSISRRPVTSLLQGYAVMYPACCCILRIA